MIRLNLLAEELAAEEARRRDPVKKAVWAAVAVLALMGLYLGSQQMKVMRSGQLLAQTQATWDKLEKPDLLLKTNMAKTTLMITRLKALEQLRTNRFLWSGPLNALQFCMTNVATIELTALTAEQGCVTNLDRGNPNAPRPTSTETIGLTLSGVDFAPGNERNDLKLKDAIARNDYFRARLPKTDNVGRPTRDAPKELADGRHGASFDLKLHFPPTLR